MDEKKETIFRKQALDRIHSPEDLDSYLSVAGPGIWFTLAAIVVLLIGVFAWMILGHLDTKMPVGGVGREGTVLWYVPSEALEEASRRGTVTIAKQTYALTDTGLGSQLITEEDDPTVRIAGMLEVGTLVKPLSIEADLPDGVYEGEIVVETVRPISFIIN